nr:DNA-directed DNA polymerase [Tanacetum cinerariifolium]
MILELADRSTTRPAALPKTTGRALIDVYGEELTLRVDDEAITFKVGQTSKYSYSDAESINQIDVIDVACEEYVQEVLRFSKIPKSGSPTPTLDPIISSSSPLFTPFEESDFILEEIVTFLRTPNELSNLDDDYYDTEGNILYLEKLQNEDPPLDLPPVKTEDLKQVDATMKKPSIEEPPKLELKELPSYLKYAFLEGTDKLPVITSKELKDEEKSALLKVLKSHKWAIAWRISDIKGIDPYFCTHIILMDDDFKPTVQHQRRVNLKIYEVIKKEVIKLLDAGLIYPISDSMWVSPIHCVPKKGCMTIVENEDNEFIPTRLVTGMRVCIDYRKLNNAIRKDHFLLPFIDQMLERLAENEFNFFLDRFFGYFQILIDPQYQEKTTFTCPYGTFAYRRMPFGLCNAAGMFQRCMMAIFHDMIEKMMEEKSHFMVKEGIVFGHKISKSEIKVDRAKVDVIAKLPHPTSVKGAKNLAADHLSRLENPHHDELEKKEITETFPLETLAKKPLISSRLAIMDPPGDIMVPTSPLKRSLISVFIGLLFTEMSMTWSHGVTLVNLKVYKSQDCKHTYGNSKPLLKDEDGEEVNVHMYRSMICSLMYLTFSRPDIMFAMCACARYQVNPKLWSTAMAKTINGEARLHAKVDGKKIIVIESSVRRDLRLADEEDEAVHKELGDRLVRVATTASSLETKQNSGNITRTQSKATPNEPSSQGTDSCGGPRKVKKLEKRNKSRTHGLKRLYKVGLSTKVESSSDEESLSEDASKQGRRINVIDADEDITLVSATDNEMFDVDVLGGEEVFVAGKNENVVEEVVDAAQDKGKGIVIEELVKPKKKDQIRLDEEERLTREKAKKEKRAILL